MNKLNVKNNRPNGTARQVQMAVLLLLAVLFTSVSARAQSKSVTIKLPAADNTSNFKITDNAATPATLFKLSGDGSLLSKGTYVSGTTAPSLGAGTRMWWFPEKGAFRVGYVSSTQWNGSNVGDYSFASGYNTTANKIYSTAMGYATTASGAASTAMGGNTTASGKYSTAMGESTKASGDYSTAMGNNATASGKYSTAMGTVTITASGWASTAMGESTTASGTASTAMGWNTTASGYYSTALGNYVSTNSHSGSFIMGDKSTTATTNSNAANQMMMRFAGGYVFYTNSSANVGVSLAASGNSWSTTSDSTKKYAFLPVNGERVLNKLRCSNNFLSCKPKFD